MANLIEPCFYCKAMPQVTFTGTEYRVIHTNPCVNQGNHTVEYWNALNALTIEGEFEIIADEPKEVIASPDSIVKEDLPEVADANPSA
jgi:hypothetical protein